MDRQRDRAGNVSSHRLAAVITLLLIAVTGCTSSQSAATPVSAAPTTTTAQAQADCTAVADAARNLGNQLSALAGGQASREQVKAAAQELRSSLDAAGAVIKPESQADADAARAAIEQLQTVLDTQPVDLAAARAAARQALESVGRVLAVCTPGTTLTPGTVAPAPTS
ncbi:MAG: hypothetical protein ACRDRV_08175 [Pseudonocardiaceae bacterium]